MPDARDHIRILITPEHFCNIVNPKYFATKKKKKKKEKTTTTKNKKNKTKIKQKKPKKHQSQESTEVHKLTQRRYQELPNMQ